MMITARNASVAFQIMPKTSGTSERPTTPVASAARAPAVALHPIPSPLGLPDHEHERRYEDQDCEKQALPPPGIYRRLPTRAGSCRSSSPARDSVICRAMKLAAPPAPGTVADDDGFQQTAGSKRSFSSRAGLASSGWPVTLAASDASTIRGRRALSTRAAGRPVASRYPRGPGSRRRGSRLREPQRARPTPPPRRHRSATLEAIVAFPTPPVPAKKRNDVRKPRHLLVLHESVRLLGQVEPLAHFLGLAPLHVLRDPGELRLRRRAAHPGRATRRRIVDADDRGLFGVRRKAKQPPVLRLRLHSF